MFSNRGLCGAIHSSVAKQMKNVVATRTAAGKEVILVGIGDKIRGVPHRTHSDQVLVPSKKWEENLPLFEIVCLPCFLHDPPLFICPVSESYH